MSHSSSAVTLRQLNPINPVHSSKHLTRFFLVSSVVKSLILSLNFFSTWSNFAFFIFYFELFLPPENSWLFQMTHSILLQATKLEETIHPRASISQFVTFLTQNRLVNDLNLKTSHLLPRYELLHLFLQIIQQMMWFLEDQLQPHRLNQYFVSKAIAGRWTF